MRVKQEGAYILRLLAVIVVTSLFLTGCVKDPVTKPDDNNSAQSVITATAAPTKAEDPTATPEPTTPAEPTSGVVVTPEPTTVPVDRPENIVIRIDSEYESICDAEPYRYYGYISYDLPTLEEEYAAKYPALNSTLQEYCSYKKDISTDEELIRGADEREFYVTDSLSTLRADSSLVCLMYDFTSFLGGVHRFFGRWGLVFDPITGEEVGLKDIVADKASFCDLVDAQIRQKYGDEYDFDNIISEYDADTLRGYIEAAYDHDELLFAVGYEYLQVLFQPYDIAPFSAGILTAEIPFAGNSLFNEKYAIAAAQYILWPDEDDRFWVDLNGDGILECLSYSLELTGEYEDIAGITFYVNGKQAGAHIKTYYSYTCTPVLIRSAHGIFIYLQMGFDSNDEATWVYKVDLADAPDKLSDSDLMKTVQRVGEEEVPQFEDKCSYAPSYMTLYGRHDLMGTSYPHAYYRVSESGLPEMLFDWYEYGDWEHSWGLTAKIDLNMKLYDPDLDMITGDYMVAAGSKLCMYRSDYETYIEFLTEDNKYVMLPITKEVIEYESFDHTIGTYVEYAPEGYETGFDDLFDGINHSD